MIGFGYDSHRLANGKKLYLGGVLVDENIGPIAHSDGDVVIHSLIDAILGALGEGDIGEFFPDTEEKYRNISSIVLLKEIINLLRAKNLSIVNIDVTVVFEGKKLGNFKQQIKENIANICGVQPNFVNVKAKTNEKMGFVGRGEGIVAFAVCQIE